MMILLIMMKVAESLAAELLAEPHGRVAMKAVHRLLIIIVIIIIMIFIMMIIIIIIIIMIMITILIMIMIIIRIMIIIIIMVIIIIIMIIDIRMIITLLHRFLAYNAEWCGNQVSSQQNYVPLILLLLTPINYGYQMKIRKADDNQIMRRWPNDQIITI